MTRVIVELEAIEGDRVVVENYRSIYKPWEGGKVLHVEARFTPVAEAWVSYRVRLNRLSERGNPIDLYVGHDSIELAP